jgi:glycine cleavage system pyridoxal-binding protein P
MTTLPPLPYDPDTLPREKARHYIAATEPEIGAMLTALGLSRLDDLFAHIPPAIRLPESLMLPEELAYEALYRHMLEQSQKNRLAEVSFLGDALPHYTVQELVPYVAIMRFFL